MVSQRQFMIACTAVLVLIVLGGLFLGSRLVNDDRQGSVRTGAAPQAESMAAQPALPPSREADAAPIVIDEIIVEKKDICAGEENLVTVRAHAARREDAAELQIIIDGNAGAQVALRPTSYLHRDGTAPRVVAHLGDQRRVSATIPVFEVRDCHPERTLDVRHRAVPKAPGRIELWANVVEYGRGDRFKPVRYRWELSDGTWEVTTTPILEKNFRDRRQDGLTHLLVTCIAEDADGHVLRGRTNVELLNGYEIAGRKGTVLLEVDHPQLPELDENGVVSWPIRVWHHHNAAVTVTRIRRIRVSRGEPGAGGREQIDEVPVASVLGTTRIPPGWIETTIQLDTRAEPDLAYVLYEMVGRTDDGYHAGGGFSVMRPSDLPAGEKHTPVAATIDPVDLPEHAPEPAAGPKRASVGPR